MRPPTQKKGRHAAARNNTPPRIVSCRLDRGRSAARRRKGCGGVKGWPAGSDAVAALKPLGRQTCLHGDSGAENRGGLFQRQRLGDADSELLPDHELGGVPAPRALGRGLAVDARLELGRRPDVVPVRIVNLAVVPFGGLEGDATGEARAALSGG